MQVKLISAAIIFGAMGLGGCSTYGDAQNFSGQDCAALRSLYGSTAARSFQDTNAPMSDFERQNAGTRAGSDAVSLSPRADLSVNQAEKDRSDIRASYSDKNC